VVLAAGSMEFINIILSTVKAEQFICYEICNVIISTVAGYKLGICTR
jgi:hypothetical protein